MVRLSSHLILRKYVSQAFVCECHISQSFFRWNDFWSSTKRQMFQQLPKNENKSPSSFTAMHSDASVQSIGLSCCRLVLVGIVTLSILSYELFFFSVFLQPYPISSSHLLSCFVMCFNRFLIRPSICAQKAQHCLIKNKGI